MTCRWWKQLLWACMVACSVILTSASLTNDPSYEVRDIPAPHPPAVANKSINIETVDFEATISNYEGKYGYSAERGREKASVLLARGGGGGGVGMSRLASLSRISFGFCGSFRTRKPEVITRNGMFIDINENGVKAQIICKERSCTLTIRDNKVSIDGVVVCKDVKKLGSSKNQLSTYQVLDSKGIWLFTDMVVLKGRKMSPDEISAYKNLWMDEVNRNKKGGENPPEERKSPDRSPIRGPTSLPTPRDALSSEPVVKKEDKKPSPTIYRRQSVYAMEIPEAVAPATDPVSKSPSRSPRTPPSKEQKRQGDRSPNSRSRSPSAGSRSPRNSEGLLTSNQELEAKEQERRRKMREVGESGAQIVADLTIEGISTTAQGGLEMARVARQPRGRIPETLINNGNAIRDSVQNNARNIRRAAQDNAKELRALQASRSVNSRSSS